MTQVPYIPDTAPFTTEQRAWLNGFLAGLFANGVVSQALAPAAPPSPAKPLLILFGSQTGTAEGLAQKFAAQARERGFAPQILPLNDFQQANFPTAESALIVSSTWGDGDPPDNATSFWSWLSADSAPRLERLSYAVLGLGDRNYSDFCGASRKFDDRLTALGAKRLIPRGECDVEYEAAAKSWIEGYWTRLAAEPEAALKPVNSLTNLAGHAEANIHASVANGAEPNGLGSKALGFYGKHNPFPARLLTNLLLNKPGSSKEVRHYELDLNGSGLCYEPGDALGVFPSNCPELVSQVITALRADPEQGVTMDAAQMSLRDALTRHLDITKPSHEFISATAKAAPDSKLAHLLAAQNPDALKTWLFGRGVIDLLHLLPRTWPLTEFLGLLKKLAPRLYSISSSPKAHPGQVHLTVSSVRYDSHGLSRKGVASTFLADRVGDTEFVRLFVQTTNHFRPPPKADTPMIMVGPGTGIAPFRAFLQHRAAVGATGQNWLFFGDQTRASDFLYESQLTTWQKQGLLARLDLAFSRDQPQKLYVQHRLLENADQVWAWLDQGAHFYVCGDASRMAKDVDEALHRIIETAGGKSPEQAKEFVSRMKIEKRYQRDVY